MWDSVTWNNVAYEHILWEESSAQTEIRLGVPKPSEMSIQHLSTNGNVRTGCETGGWTRCCYDASLNFLFVLQLVLAAVGCGLYVYNVVTKAVVAYRRAAHNSDVLHTMLLSDR